MAPEIRTLRVEEFDAFMRYVECAFGHSKGFFARDYPQCYQPTEEACSWAYIIKEGDEIVSHVGVYPLDTMTAGVRMQMGGLGAVSTAPKARGKGYMSHLLRHVVNEMRRIGYPVSWLSGDRQRYGEVGYEVTGPTYTLVFSNRSLKWHKVQPVDMVEVYPEEALATIEKFSGLPACYSNRHHLDLHLQKNDSRFFISGDGYAILRGQERHQLNIQELVSVSGNEVGWIRALLDWNFGDRAHWEFSKWDEERLARMMPYAGYWEAGSSGMYRINDLAQTLAASQDYLQQRAAGVNDFDITVAMVEHDRTTAVRMTLKDGVFSSEAADPAGADVTLSAMEAARLFLGGPAIPNQAALPVALKLMLPIPVYVLPYDHV